MSSTGILVIDKPLNLTSHDVVSKLRRAFSTRRIGHAGTLDPLASGVLVVAVGPATRFLQYLALEPKIYVADITFGRATSTYDAEGETTSEAPRPVDLQSQLEALLRNFLGSQEQLPPIYSAIKVAGRPMYSYARSGETVERRPRTIYIKSLDAHWLDQATVRLEVVCSGGTYIRSLAHDLGQRIGTGAYLSGLRRTAVGRFLIADAVPLDQASVSNLMSLSEALKPMPSLTLFPQQEVRIRHGQPIELDLQAEEGEKFTLLSEQAEVIGIGTVLGTSIHPECVLPNQAVEV